MRASPRVSWVFKGRNLSPKSEVKRVRHLRARRGGKRTGDDLNPTPIRPCRVSYHRAKRERGANARHPKSEQVSERPLPRASTQRSQHVSRNDPAVPAIMRPRGFRPNALLWLGISQGKAEPTDTATIVLDLHFQDGGAVNQVIVDGAERHSLMGKHLASLPKGLIGRDQR